MTTRVRAAAQAHAAQNTSQLCKDALPEHSRLRRSRMVLAAHPATRLEQGAPLQALHFSAFASLREQNQDGSVSAARPAAPALSRPA